MSVSDDTAVDSEALPGGAGKSGGGTLQVRSALECTAAVQAGTRAPTCSRRQARHAAAGPAEPVTGLWPAAVMQAGAASQPPQTRQSHAHALHNTPVHLLRGLLPCGVRPSSVSSCGALVTAAPAAHCVSWFSILRAAAVLLLCCSCSCGASVTYCTCLRSRWWQSWRHTGAVGCDVQCRNKCNGLHVSSKWVPSD